MHHFEALEYICQQMQQALKPGGLIILNEYVGPNRFQFPAQQKQAINLCLSLLPQRYRITVPDFVSHETERNPFQKDISWFVTRLLDKIQDGDLLNTLKRKLSLYRSNPEAFERTEIHFPTVRDMMAADPTEAVRSEEIIKILNNYFDLIEKKDWGGNILHYLMGGIVGNFHENDEEAQSFLKLLIGIEDTFLETGEFQSDFAYLVARKRVN
jgi:SAM-dependent methyltransferase